MPINLFNLFDSFWTDPWSSVLGPRSSVLGPRSSVLGPWSLILDPWSLILDLVILDPVILTPWSLILDPWSLIQWSSDPAILDLVFPGNQVRFLLGTQRRKNIFLYFFTELKTYHLSYFYLSGDSCCFNLALPSLLFMSKDRNDSDGKASLKRKKSPEITTDTKDVNKCHWFYV